MTVFIDLDGTLLDTLDANFLAYRETLMVLGIELEYGFFRDECFGSSSREFLKKWTLSPESIEFVVDSKRRLYPSFYPKIQIKEMLIQNLNVLRDRYDLAIFTNSSRLPTIDLLKHFNLVDYFDQVITLDDFIYPKPSDASFEFALSKNKINTIPFLIDDLEQNITTAINLGMRAINIKDFDLQFFEI